MPTNKTPKRICQVDPAGGGLSVTLSATNSLRAVGNLVIYLDPKEPEESWSASSGDTGRDEHPVETSAASVVGGSMTWSIVVCAQIASQDAGEVAITVQQDGKPCPIVEPAVWSITGVAPCSSSKKKRIRGELQFVKKT